MYKYPGCPTTHHTWTGDVGELPAVLEAVAMFLKDYRHEQILDITTDLDSQGVSVTVYLFGEHT